MPEKNKYISTSILFNNLDMVEKIAKNQVSKEYLDFVKVNNSYRKKLAELSQQQSELKNDLGKFTQIEKQKKEIKDKQNELATQYEDVVEGRDEYLYHLCNIKGLIGKASRENKLSSANYAAFKDVLSFVATDLFPDEFVVNGSEQTGDAVKALFANLAKREVKKMAIAEKLALNSTKISLDKAMEAESYGGKPTVTDCKNIIKSFKAFSDRFYNADDNLHINSSEYRALTKAFKNVEKELSAETVDPVAVGDKLEALQNAAVKYIKEKGIGGQSTDLGKERLQLALDVANSAFKYGDIFQSRNALIRAENCKEINRTIKVESVGSLEDRFSQRFEVKDTSVEEIRVDVAENIMTELQEFAGEDKIVLGDDEELFGSINGIELDDDDAEIEI